MLISEAPKAAETKSRREKDGLLSTVAGETSFLSSIACSLITRIEKTKRASHPGRRLAAGMDALVLCAHLRFALPGRH
ncbi:hypothetical protein [Dechloromonas sp.]|uniref:hypothetical protein n=1 Tax=Dechloromonas sp. TaxID=1917218 RepID=UPI00263F9744|nr:hypothetical protein [Dechloromonas sp.]